MHKKIGPGTWVPILLVVLLVTLFVSSVTSKKTTSPNVEVSNSRTVAFTCTVDMATQFHIHSRLTILIDGKKEVIPANIGIEMGCMHPIHTHDTDGIIHVESPVQEDFTLGDFFAVWGKDFSKNAILGHTGGTISVTINNMSVDTFENTILKDDMAIVITYRSH